MEDRGAFILSLDCEGNWGMADNPSLLASGVINDSSLQAAYGHIIATLDRSGLKATAAFVSAFAVDAEVLHENWSMIEALAGREPWWFDSIRKALSSRAGSGWRGAPYYRALQTAGAEMAWHGATHLPLSASTSCESVALELELANKLLGALGTRPRSVVFPRNEIGHLDDVRRLGFAVYRDSLNRGGAARFLNLLQEFDVFAGCDRDVGAVRDGWRVCRPGSFLNWPSGARALVPPAITIRRWRSMLRDAAESGGSVHMWFHPHNLITAPTMKIAFDEILRFAGELVRTGDLVALTMAEAGERMQAEIAA